MLLHIRTIGTTVPVCRWVPVLATQTTSRHTHHRCPTHPVQGDGRSCRWTAFSQNIYGQTRRWTRALRILDADVVAMFYPRRSGEGTTEAVSCNIRVASPVAVNLEPLGLGPYAPPAAVCTLLECFLHSPSRCLHIPSPVPASQSVSVPRVLSLTFSACPSGSLARTPFSAHVLHVVYIQPPTAYAHPFHTAASH